LAVPLGFLILTGVVLLAFLGVTHRVLDRMKLRPGTALFLLGIMVAGFFMPEARVTRGISVDLGGALVPLGIAIYLVGSADQAAERLRATLAAFATAAIVLVADQLLPAEPGEAIPVLDLDPLWTPGIVAGVVAYLAGRSRRAAFVAGVGGVVLADLFVAVTNAFRPGPSGAVAIGGAGALDSVVIAGVLAVALAEVVGETREAWTRLRRHRAGRAGAGRRRIRQLPAGAAPLLGLAAVTVLLAAAAWAGPRVWGTHEHLPAAYYRLVDESGTVLLETGRRIYVGDEWIDADNVHYRVRQVRRRVATAQTLGVLEASPAGASVGLTVRPGLFEWLLGVGRDTGDGTTGPPPGGKRAGPVGIYHTHNAESYIPTDGTYSINGRGGIHEVGWVLARRLEELDFQVIFSEALHLPHDRGAYRRSRRTVAKLLRERPIVLLDVHRDAAPPEFYAERVAGQWMTQIRLVVGRQNPAGKTNLQFARELKAVADEMYPGLIKGIWYGRGNYNQDVGPRALLLEVGAHTNTRESAQRAAGLFAEVLDRYFEPGQD